MDFMSSILIQREKQQKIWPDGLNSNNTPQEHQHKLPFPKPCAGARLLHPLVK